MQQDRIQCIAHKLQCATNAWAFTGAGVSTDSGIPDFRSPDSGLWERVDPLQVASIQGFLEDPPRFYQFWRWRFGALSQAEPNLTHRFLAELEGQGLLKGVITQNIDGLHRKAGSQNVYELHGAYQQGACIRCKKAYTIEQIFQRAQADGHPRCDDCAGLLKPNVVLFGEQLPAAFYDAWAALRRCDLLLVLGTSLEVFPAAEIVPQVKAAGGQLVLVNAQETEMDHLADVVIHARLETVVEPLFRMLERGEGKPRFP